MTEFMHAFPFFVAFLAIVSAMILVVPGFAERWRVTRGDAAGRALFVSFDAVTIAVAALVVACLVTGCRPRDSDARQREAQEVVLQEATSEVPLPAIVNFRERKLMKMLYELRDREDLATYTYVVAENTGALAFMCDSLGYGMPAATQMTSPSKPDYGEHGNFAMPQAEPNGLFSPADAEATWVMCRDPGGDGVKAVYAEARLVVSPFKLGANPERAQ